MRCLASRIILSVSVVLLTACGQPAGESAAVEEPQATPPTPAAAPVVTPEAAVQPEEADQGLPEEEQQQLKAQYATEAEQAITSENADAVADALENEIDAELATAD
jgi:hypothetical protein